MRAIRAWSGVLLAAVLALSIPGGAGAQEASLLVEGPSGQQERFEVVRHRGYAAVSTAVLERVGWMIQVRDEGVEARLGPDATMRLTAGNPFLSWNGEVLQLAEPPYFFAERLHVPLQLITDVLPRRVEDGYASDSSAPSLTVRSASLWRARSGGGGEPSSSAPERDARGEGGVVVVVDPGHGGKDPGARGRSGVLEKEVTLGVARALARELEGAPGMEVHLTRGDDSFVPIWERGEMATRWKGDRPGVFVSLHVNAASRSPSVRGFETYFLSEARTDHERRVAALENAPLEEFGEEDGGEAGTDLGFILNDLRNRGHQPWSSQLAQMVQDHLEPVHPGPNRGVKQGPFAVITNALMPGVLVELGFVTNGPEARLLARRSFQEDAARALAGALRDFFERYPPGTEVTAGGSG